MSRDIVIHPKAQLLVNKLIVKLPHAMIIDGPIGIGVATVAKMLANEHGSPELIIQPQKIDKGKPVVDQENGRILIEDMRQLYKSTRTQQPGRHVYIIDTGTNTMTHAAQNAFLKILEEPRSGLHFIIVTHHYDSLLPTVQSRCQRLSLPPVTDGQTAKLIHDLDVSDETKRTRLAFIARGLPALLLRLADNDNVFASRVAIMQDAKTMLEGTLYDKVSTINRYRDNRSSAMTLLDDMCHQLRIIMLSQPIQRLSDDVNRYLEAQSNISNGGNIRLQLAAAVI